MKHMQMINYLKVSKMLSKGKVIGWFCGAMEFGPRALGSRSIIGDPRKKEMQKIMNQKIKYRESFRPFAPAVLEEDAGKIFEINVKVLICYLLQQSKNIF